MVKPHHILNFNIHIILSLLFFLLARPGQAYSVVDFWARPDGQSDSTPAFKKAWAWACGLTRPVTLYVPRGNFVVRPMYFSGPCKSPVTISIQGKIIAPSDYRVLAQAKYWLMFYRVNGITIKGGTIDARGHPYWTCKQRYGGNCDGGASSISIIGCNKVVVEGLTSLNSQKMHIGITGCNNVNLRYLTIRAPSESPNTDGILIHQSSGVTVFSSVIGTGDDCIALGPGAKNIWMQHIVCGPGHGISIGSLGNSLHEDGVQNITLTGATFTETQNGVRIKTWARPSDGFVRTVLFRNLIMRNVYNPIVILQTYCPTGQCPRQTSGVKISGVKYSNIKGTSGSKTAIQFECSPSEPCTGLQLQDINLTHSGSPAVSYCSRAHGKSRGSVTPSSCL